MIKSDLKETESSTMRSVYEESFSNMKKINNENELKQALTQFSSNPDEVYNNALKLQKRILILNARNSSEDDFSTMLSKSLVKKSLVRSSYQSNTKNLRPDCPGNCSEMFSVSIQNCNNALGLALGVAAGMGALSAGIGGAATLIGAVGSYMICENYCFYSLENCTKGCGG